MADFNGDGNADLAVTNQASYTVSVLLGNGSGGFGALSNFPAVRTPTWVAVGDFNGDGILDLAVANEADSRVSVLVGDGAGGFGAASTFAVSTYPVEVAVGDFNGDGRADLVTANYNSSDLSVLLNGCSSASLTPTVTGTPPTATPTSTACPIQFSDIPANDPFYPYIRCLACRQILNGYTTSPPCATAPCFLPGANITRGQTAKIVANAAGFNDAVPSTQQTFEDVLPSDPFWVFIEGLALPGRGYISGYTCGSPPAGPCVPPGNRPYFLGGNNVTRGQLAKIVANAAGYQDPIPSSQQSFEDIPPTNAFWLYVERVALHNVISGYGCGSLPAGPCVPPGNRPYFVGGNPATRAQTAKIVTNDFFPGCPGPSPTPTGTPTPTFTPGPTFTPAPTHIPP